MVFTFSWLPFYWFYHRSLLRGKVFFANFPPHCKPREILKEVNNNRLQLAQQVPHEWQHHPRDRFLAVFKGSTILRYVIHHSLMGLSSFVCAHFQSHFALLTKVLNFKGFFQMEDEKSSCCWAKSVFQTRRSIGFPFRNPSSSRVFLSLRRRNFN